MPDYQQNSCVGISLSAILLKRDSKTGVFLWGLSNFQEYLFRRTPSHCFSENWGCQNVREHLRNVRSRRHSRNKELWCIFIQLRSSLSKTPLVVLQSLALLMVTYLSLVPLANSLVNPDHYITSATPVSTHECSRMCHWNHYTKKEVFHQGFLKQMWPNPLETSDLVTFTEEIFNGKFHFAMYLFPCEIQNRNVSKYKMILYKVYPCWETISYQRITYENYTAAATQRCSL